RSGCPRAAPSTSASSAAPDRRGVADAGSRLAAHPAEDDRERRRAEALHELRVLRVELAGAVEDRRILLLGMLGDHRGVGGRDLRRLLGSDRRRRVAAAENAPENATG